MDKAILIIHGGAGIITRASLSPEREALFAASLNRVLLNGRSALRAGKSAVDVVTAAVAELEDDPLFNAGIGAVLNSDGRHELDAAVMSHVSREGVPYAGSVCAMERCRNPILAARALADATAASGNIGPVMLAGRGADVWAERAGLAMVENSYFTTPFRVAQLEAARATRSIKRDHDVGVEASAPIDEETKRGTVGAVCLDASGGLAAATSTGGLTNKLAGRVGDTPVLGAGTWADANIAVSGTGTGEAFLRRATAKDIAARVAYGGVSIAAAAEAAVGDLIGAGGDGGVIAVDSTGRGCMVFNSEGMYRGSVRANEDASPLVAIYRSHAAEQSGVCVEATFTC